VHSTATGIKLSVKRSTPDPVRLPAGSINWIKSNNNFHWSTGGTSFLLKAVPLANLHFQRPAVSALEWFKIPAASDFIVIRVRGRWGREECSFLQPRRPVQGSAGWAGIPKTRIIFKEGHEKVRS